ncbi:transcription factor E2F3-like protein, partial [Sarcoptes scabiei]
TNFLHSFPNYELKVKRRLDWDSTSDSTIVAKTTMTAVNGKPVSVRTFKLSNAMKQSLVASGCSKAVAVAAVAAAYKANGNCDDHEKLIASTTCPGNIIGNQGGTAVQFVTTTGNNLNSSTLSTGDLIHHPSPTAIAIVNGASRSATGTPLTTIVTAKTPSVNIPQQINNNTSSHSNQGIFKTPLVPKVTMSPMAATSLVPTNLVGSNQPTQFIIVNKNINQDLLSSLSTAASLEPKVMIATSDGGCPNDSVPKTSTVRLTPILATSAAKPIVASPNTNRKHNRQNPNKRARTNNMVPSIETATDTTTSNRRGKNNSRSRNNNKTVQSNGIDNLNENRFYFINNHNSSCIYSPSSNHSASSPQNNLSSSSSSLAFTKIAGNNCSNKSFFNTSSSFTNFYGASSSLSPSSCSSNECITITNNNAKSINGDGRKSSLSSSSSSTNGGGRGGGRTRHETSLGQLTVKFISLLEKSSDGSINLNIASDLLNVQKRRIYDITNVLEGVGLLHKTSKNNIQWRGGLVDYISGKTTAESVDQTSHYRNRKPPPLSLLFGSNQSNSNENNLNLSSNITNSGSQESLSDLENDENRLDHLLQLARDDLNKIKKDQTLCSHLYASYMDLRRVPEFKEQTVIGIRPPNDTMLELPEPSSEGLQIWLKNPRGEMIEVYLCPHISDDDETKEKIVSSRKNSTSNEFGDVMMRKTLKKSTNNENEAAKSEIRSDLNNCESGYNSYFGGDTSNAASSSAIECSKPIINLSSMYHHHQHQDQSQTAECPNRIFEKSMLSSSSVFDETENQILCKSEPSSSHENYAYAFICHDDEFGPMGSKTYLTQPTTPTVSVGDDDDHHLRQIKSSLSESDHDPHFDHNLLNPNHSDQFQTPNNYLSQSNHYHSPISSSPLALIPLDPPMLVADNDYNFTLCDNEGIAELFDDDFTLPMET